MLAATALCLTLLTQNRPEPPNTLRGVVVEKGTGRPLGGVTVRFSEEPGAPTATTDAQGRFDGLPTVQENNVPRDGQPGPTGRVRAEDERAWPWEVVEPDIMVRYPPGYLRKQAIEALYHRAETRWRGTGVAGTLVVECPPIGVIEAVVRGPDGLPLADRPILLFPESDSPRHSGIIHLSGRTDRAGAFRLPSYEGVRQVVVHAPGLGFGSTGRVAVVGGVVVRLEIPPLARFARVEGRLAPSLIAPGITAALLSEPFQRPTGIAAPCDEQGRFALVDVVPGVYRVVAQRGGQNVPTAYRVVQPEPGRVIGDVVLDSPPPTPEGRKENERLLRQLNGDRNQIITWVEGTIRDEKGQALPGALVYLHFQYSGGIRMMEEAKNATADERGYYRFDGPLQSSIGMLTVVASAKGRPPAIAYAPGPDTTLDEGDRKPARLDVSLGSAGGTADVAVVRDGRPLAGVAVQLSSRGAVALSSPFYVGRARGGERGQIEDLVSPTATTGAEGVARFENLLPGAYELIAIDSPDPAQLLQVRWPRVPGLAFGIAEGVAVPPGGKVETSVALHRQPGTVRFRLLKPDGSPVVGQSAALGFGQGRVGATTSLKFDERGIGSHDFERPGLWAVEFKFRDSELQSFPIQDEPYYVAKALIPVSPGVANDDPVTLRAVRRDRGAIRAQLLDAAGMPARGTVMIVDDGRGTIRQAGTVDAGGSIRFADLSSGRYRVRGVVEGQTSAPRPRAGATRFDDAALRGHATVLDREVTLDPGAEAMVDLRLEPVGYVRATLRAPAGRSPSDYTAQLRFDPSADRRIQDVESDPEAGTYLFGPIRPGRWPIVLRECVEPGPYPVRGERPVVVEPGQVARVEVEPDPSPAQPQATRSRQQVFLGMGGISLLDSGPEGFSATVLLPDGSTPAFGARALFFPADGREPTAEGVADGSGRLTWTGRWRGQPDGAEASPEPVKEPTIAAWMPGLAGPVVATVVPEKPFRLVLPAPAGVPGRVTLGGHGVEGRNARVRVVAVPEKPGVLAVAFGREATADPDGRFRFSGLAPGRYLVQAARDSLWLSKAVPVLIEPGKDADPIDLDIPEPGGPVVLDLVDGQDRPIPDLSFAIRRPEGPLARALPMTHRTDGRGSALVRGLEAGSHSLVADGDSEPHGFAVPPARLGGTPQAIRIQVARPAH